MVYDNNPAFRNITSPGRPGGAARFVALGGGHLHPGWCTTIIPHPGWVRPCIEFFSFIPVCKSVSVCMSWNLCFYGKTISRRTHTAGVRNYIQGDRSFAASTRRCKTIHPLRGQCTNSSAPAFQTVLKHPQCQLCPGVRQLIRGSLPLRRRDAVLYRFPVSADSDCVSASLKVPRNHLPVSGLSGDHTTPSDI